MQLFFVLTSMPAKRKRNRVTDKTQNPVKKSKTTAVDRFEAAAKRTLRGDRLTPVLWRLILSHVKASHLRFNKMAIVQSLINDCHSFNSDVLSNAINRDLHPSIVDYIHAHQQPCAYPSIPYVYRCNFMRSNILSVCAEHGYTEVVKHYLPIFSQTWFQAPNHQWMLKQCSIKQPNGSVGSVGWKRWSWFEAP